MRIELSEQSINAIAEVISGGSAGSGEPPIGLYRQGWKLTDWFRPFHISFNTGLSRFPATVQAVSLIGAWDNADEQLEKLICKAADPRDFAHDEPRHQAVLEYLNKHLLFDGLRIERDSYRVRLVEIIQHASVVGAFSSAAEALDLDTVKRDLDRALYSAEKDPEDAVTAACSVVESVCRSILVGSDLDLPTKQDISGLYRAVREPLGLSPTKDGVPDLIAEDVRSTLSGLVTAVQSMGALRTHGGDAHGRERGFRRVDARIARLAIHSASAVSLFLIETWQLRFPEKMLRKR